jgi:uncharacterized membrane protein YiaA
MRNLISGAETHLGSDRFIPGVRFAFSESGYFLAVAVAAALSAYFFWKRSMRPAVSSNFCLPVKKGWQLEQTSTRIASPLIVDRVWNLLPQAQLTVTAW